MGAGGCGDRRGDNAQAEPGDEQRGQHRRQDLHGRNRRRRADAKRRGGGASRDRERRREPATARRCGRQRGPPPVERAGGARGQCLAGVAQHEAVEARGGGEAEACGQRRIGGGRSGKRARRPSARRDRQNDVPVFDERQHAMHGGFDQAIVVERAAPAR